MPMPPQRGMRPAPQQAPMPPPEPSPLQRYMMQQQATGQGQGPRGAGGMPAVPMGPGVANPYNQGEDAPSEINPMDGQNEFDPRRRQRPYMGGMA